MRKLGIFIVVLCSIMLIGCRREKDPFEYYDYIIYQNLSSQDVKVSELEHRGYIDVMYVPSQSTSDAVCWGDYYYFIGFIIQNKVSLDTLYVYETETCSVSKKMDDCMPTGGEFERITNDSTANFCTGYTYRITLTDELFDNWRKEHFDEYRGGSK